MQKVFVVAYHNGAGALAVTTDRAEAEDLCRPCYSPVSGEMGMRVYKAYNLVDYIDKCRPAFEYALLRYRRSALEDRLRRMDYSHPAYWSIEARTRLVVEVLDQRIRALEWDVGKPMPDVWQDTLYSSLGMAFSSHLWLGSAKSVK